MRLTMLAVLAAGLTLGGAARADDAAKAVITKAIEAHGGAEKLDKFKAARVKVKGTVVEMGLEIPFAGEALSQYPAQAKAVLKLEINGMMIDLIQVINGDKAVVKLNGERQPVNSDMLQELRQETYSSSLTQLTPLLKEPFTLKALGEKKVDGKTLVGVRVTNKKFKDVSLFFDKESGLLARMERAGRAEGKDVPQEHTFSDYKEFNGLKVATKEKVLKDGKQTQDVVSTEFTPLEKLDDKEFTTDD